MTKRIWILYAAASLAVVLIAGVIAYLHFAPVGKVVLIRTFSGGMCSGPGDQGPGECNSETKLYSNGHFGDTYIGHDRVQKLQQLIAATDFSKYTQNDSQPTTCNSAWDGSDVGYYFPTKTGSEHFTECTLDIPANDPLFSFLDTLN